MSFTAGQIKAAARGRWDVVFSVLAPSLKAAMRAGRKHHVSCPKHGGTDGFRLYPDWLGRLHLQHLRIALRRVRHPSVAQ